MLNTYRLQRSVCVLWLLLADDVCMFVVCEGKTACCRIAHLDVSGALIVCVSTCCSAVFALPCERVLSTVGNSTHSHQQDDAHIVLCTLCRCCASDSYPHTTKCVCACVHIAYVCTCTNNKKC